MGDVRTSSGMVVSLNRLVVGGSWMDSVDASGEVACSGVGVLSIVPCDVVACGSSAVFPSAFVL